MVLSEGASEPALEAWPRGEVVESKLPVSEDKPDRPTGGTVYTSPAPMTTGMTTGRAVVLVKVVSSSFCKNGLLRLLAVERADSALAVMFVGWR